MVAVTLIRRPRPSESEALLTIRRLNRAVGSSPSSRIRFMRAQCLAIAVLIGFALAGCAHNQALLAPAPDPAAPYTLDAGDRLRVVVFGQDGLSSSYAVDPSGKITMPLIGGVPARGLTTVEVGQA